jgi:hypothetical protein
MTLRSTEHLTEYLLEGKGGQNVSLTTLSSSCAESLEIWEPQSVGTFREFSGLYRDCLNLEQSIGH